MKSGFVRRLLQGGLGVLMCAMAASSLAQQKPEALSIRLDWSPWGDQAAFHLAQHKGWYKKAGLDVTIEDGNGSTTTVQIIGSSDHFDVGYASLGSMIIARDKGLPVKAVAPFFRKSDIGVLVPADSGMKGPKDLKGKKLLYTAGSLEAPFIDSFLKAGDVSRNDIDLVNIDAAAKITSYAVGRSDAVVSTIAYVLPFVFAERESRAIAFADYGLGMPGYGIFASEKSLAAKPEAIAKFASITALAWQYIYDGHQDEAVQAVLAQRPQARLNKEVLRGQIDALYDFKGGEPGVNDRMGVPVPADWEGGVKTLRSVGLISDALQPSDLYVADMVDPDKYRALLDE